MTVYSMLYYSSYIISGRGPFGWQYLSNTTFREDCRPRENMVGVNMVLA